MKTPTELSQSLCRQWHNADLREQRLLSSHAWPITLSIGKPSAQTFAGEGSALQAHLKAWRAVSIGTVEWIPVQYKAGAEAVSLPMKWVLHSPSDWIRACQNSEVERTYRKLARLVEAADPKYHKLLVRQPTLWKEKPLEDCLSALALASDLKPGIAKGRPLRLLAEYQVDTKFFERNATLLTKLLDLRFNGQVSEQSLHVFLDAEADKDHWLQLVVLCPKLLPFKRLRVTAQELRDVNLPCQYIIVVENEQCRHQLPPLADTIAILGAGLDLNWLQGKHWQRKHIAYWGDIDTWGLTMLARARTYCPKIVSVLMNPSVFMAHHATLTVPEPAPAGQQPPPGLSSDETDLYQTLLDSDKGRLEQEFLPVTLVHQSLYDWHKSQVDKNRKKLEP